MFEAPNMDTAKELHEGIIDFAERAPKGD